ncbi:asparaginase [Aquincola sp. MAHUQ-54]|uniref:Asparaginase n=1 Tax=Aquincola agrisoli TaxID=3119538 RepID=A0AAW9QRX5_9BURK
MQNKIVILGTGGTIAGAAASPTDTVGYTAAQFGVDELVAAVPALAGRPLETAQVAQIDSKDMRFDVWCALAAAAAGHLARPEVAGVVVTHGTDTLEESAYFLQRVLSPAKPVVMVAAMRPATALGADGPQNLLDAVTLAGTPGVQGVLAVLAGTVHAGAEVRKTHPYRLDAFGSGDAGPLARIEAGRLRQFRNWPASGAAEAARLAQKVAQAAGRWPWVEILTSTTGTDGRAVDALRAAGVAGIVAAGTGNGALHGAMEAALREAQAAGVRVLRCTRCAEGGVIDTAGALPSAGTLTPQQARVALLLALLDTPGGDARP